MPFITEELYQRIPAGDKRESIMVEEYPEPDQVGARIKAQNWGRLQGYRVCLQKSVRN